MKVVSNDDVSPIAMSTKPHQFIADANNKIIFQGFIYEWVGIGWVKCEKSSKKDLKYIPVLVK